MREIVGTDCLADDRPNHPVRLARRLARLCLVATAAIGLAGCGLFGGGDVPPGGGAENAEAPPYLIGAGDTLQIFVWRNPELTVTVPVRPDGRVSVPLIEDIEVARKTPTQLARDIEKQLKVFIQDPIVTVIVTGFVGPFQQQVRVIGEAAKPQALPYREQMSLLDVMIQVGGLTPFAAGSRALLVRRVDGEEKTYQVNIDKLLKYGDLSYNVRLLPGDVLVVPQAWF
jgi:polysaccharide export outer membrane protein